MKKKFYIIGLLGLLLTGISSCTDWLTIKPQSEVVLADYWKTSSDVQAVLAACYRGLTEDDVIYRMIVWGELRSDNLMKGNSGFDYDRDDIRKILEGDLTPTNKYASWKSFYSVINYCNFILHYAPDVLKKDNNFTIDDLRKVQAEALTIRSLCYFYLVRTFKEVPLITTASVDDTQNYAVAKAPEQAILDTITANLLFAQKYAKTDFGRIDYNKGRITLNAVNALLADVYLWSQQYEKCAQTCDLVLTDARLSLVPAADMFTKVFYIGNSTESIFELQFNDNIQTNSPVKYLYGYGRNGELGFSEFLAYYRYPAGKEFTGDFSPFNHIVGTSRESVVDIRADQFYYPSGGSSYKIFKYAGIQMKPDLTIGNPPIPSERNNTPNWILYRLSDVMLMKAEALVQLEGEENMKNALVLVNTTYIRSNPLQDSLKISNYQTKAAMEELVLRERQRELLFEGKRWFDLVRLAKRNGSPKIVNDFITHKASKGSVSLDVSEMNALYMPISKSELLSNPNLKQNEYYDESSTITR